MREGWRKTMIECESVCVYVCVKKERMKRQIYRQIDRQIERESEREREKKREREQRKKNKEGREIEKVRQGKGGYYYTVSLQHLSSYNYDIEIEMK